MQKDIYFDGLGDKEEGMNIPDFYAENLESSIVTKTERCDGVTYGDQSVAIAEGGEYCLRTQSGEDFINIRVIELLDDWSEVTIEWEKLNVIDLDVDFSWLSFVWLTNWFNGLNKNDLIYGVLILVLLVMIGFVIRAIRGISGGESHVGYHAGQEGDVQAYCLRCRRHVDIYHPENAILDNGSIAVKGRCLYCDQRVSAIIGRDDEKHNTAYCLSCKRKRYIHNPKKITLKNGAVALKGKCPQCNNELMEIIAKGKDEREVGYCLKCHKNQRLASSKHVHLDNNSEAIKGRCSKCAHWVMRIFSRLKDTRTRVFCVNCKKIRRLEESREVKLKNNAMAVKGTCPKCKHEVTSITAKGRDERMTAYCGKCARIQHMDRVRKAPSNDNSYEYDGKCSHCRSHIYKYHPSKDPGYHPVHIAKKSHKTVLHKVKVKGEKAYCGRCGENQFMDRVKMAPKGETTYTLEGLCAVCRKHIYQYDINKIPKKKVNVQKKRKNGNRKKYNQETQQKKSFWRRIFG